VAAQGGQLVLQRGRGGPAVGGVRGEAAGQHPGTAADPAVEPGVERGVGEAVGDDRGGAVSGAPERRLGQDERRQRGPEREQVRPGVHPARELLGRGVPRGPRGVASVAGPPADPEVGDLDHARLVTQQVAGLDVAVDEPAGGPVDPRPVDVGQAGARLDADVEQHRPGDRALARQLPHGEAAHQLEGDEHDAVDLGELVGADDVRVLEQGPDPRLVDEVVELGALGHPRRDELERDRAREAPGPVQDGLPRLSAAAFSQAPDQRVPAEALALPWLHRGSLAAFATDRPAELEVDPVDVRRGLRHLQRLEVRPAPRHRHEVEPSVRRPLARPLLRLFVGRHHQLLEREQHLQREVVQRVGRAQVRHRPTVSRPSGPVEQMPRQKCRSETRSRQ
jgi:hypothetical protein